MKNIPANTDLLSKLTQDKHLNSFTNLSDLRNSYELASELFHSHFVHHGQVQHENALYHKIRYLEILDIKWSGNVLDVGNDKPFLSFFLRKFNPSTKFFTISNSIPETPYLLYEVDVELEEFPFEKESFDQVIFTEVIEHLWRNPSKCIFEINRVLRLGGSAYVTTPNPCDRHALVCILWQTNPNQRSGYFSTLESGHLHLWTCSDLQLIFEAHGMETMSLCTKDLYGHTKPDDNIEEFIQRISKYRDYMNETIVLSLKKTRTAEALMYPREIFPDGTPVEFNGVIQRFALQSIMKLMDV